MGGQYHIIQVTPCRVLDDRSPDQLRGSLRGRGLQRAVAGTACMARGCRPAWHGMAWHGTFMFCDRQHGTSGACTRGLRCVQRPPPAGSLMCRACREAELGAGAVAEAIPPPAPSPPPQADNSASSAPGFAAGSSSGSSNGGAHGAAGVTSPVGHQDGFAGAVAFAGPGSGMGQVRGHSSHPEGASFPAASRPAAHLQAHLPQVSCWLAGPGSGEGSGQSGPTS